MPEKTISVDQPSAAWRAALPVFVILLLVIVALYRETAMSMVAIWSRSETFAHAFLVPPITLWLVWRLRHDLRNLRPQPNYWVLLLAVGVGLGWLMGELASVAVLTQLALTTMVVLAVPGLFGLNIARKIAFPLAFLYFCVPFGEFALPQLMEWTATFTVFGLRLSGIPVYREGLQFIIPSGSWSVVEACSGVRYIIASLTVGTLFAYLSYRSLTRRLVFVGVSFVVPLVANWVRAYIIVMLGHLSGNKLATGVDHLIYGWLFFGVVIFVMFIIGSRWSESSAAPEISIEVPARPVERSKTDKYWVPALLIVGIMAIPPMAGWVLQRMGNASVPALPEMAQLEAGWEASGDALSPAWTPAFSNPSVDRNTVYVANGQTVGLYLGYYRQQSYERKLISSENVLVKSGDPVWARVFSRRENLAFGGAPVVVRRAELRAGNAHTDLLRLTVWQFYWINGYLTSSDYVAKLLTAIMKLIGRGDDSAVIILYSPKEQSAGGDQAISSFVEANSKRILQILADVRANR